MKNQVSTNSQTKDLWSFLVIQPLRYSDQIYWLSLSHWIPNDILPITKKFTSQKITHWQLHVPCNVCKLPPFLCSIMKHFIYILFFINTNVNKKRNQPHRGSRDQLLQAIYNEVKTEAKRTLYWLFICLRRRDVSLLLLWIDFSGKWTFLSNKLDCAGPCIEKNITVSTGKWILNVSIKGIFSKEEKCAFFKNVNSINYSSLKGLLYFWKTYPVKML